MSTTRRRHRVADNADVVEFRGVVFQIDVHTYAPPTVSPLPGLHIMVTEPISGETVYDERIRFSALDRDELFIALDEVAGLYTTEHSSVVRAYTRYIERVLSNIESSNREYLDGIPDDWSSNQEWLAVHDRRRQD
ncbi:MAG TPA: hypothetical protein VFT64_08510 [Rickettsiales bacterium]|nr:hypothetical protein [Rickettsiales bacterium]